MAGRPKSNRTCSLSGCERKHYALGYCRPHYGRVRRNGDPGSVAIVLQGPHVTAHGTVNGYNNYGCRCDACTEAHRQYMYDRARNALCAGGCERTVWRYTKTGLCKTCLGERQRKPTQHGTVLESRRGCKCALCRAAAAKERRDFRARTGR